MNDETTELTKQLHAKETKVDSDVLGHRMCCSSTCWLCLFCRSLNTVGFRCLLCLLVASLACRVAAASCRLSTASVVWKMQENSV